MKLYFYLIIILFAWSQLVVAQPDWDFNFRQYEHSMNINGVLQLEGTNLDNSSEIIVAAFDKQGNVIGKAEPFLYTSIGKYRIPLAVFGDRQNDSVFFRVYIADLNSIFYLDQALTFSADQIIGHFEQPYVFDMNDAITSLSSQEIQEISVYPNPATETITISGFEKHGNQVVIYDVHGKEVMKELITSDHAQINISKLHSGFYYLYSIPGIKPLKFIKR